MTSADPLSRLVATLGSSPAMYLAVSGIQTYPGTEELRLALADVAGDHTNLVDRAAVILEDREMPLPRAAYPLSFTAWHDLDLRYLLPRVIETLRRQAAQFDTIAGDAGDDLAAAELAAEAARSTRGHVDRLSDLAVRLRAGLSGRAAPAAS